MVTRREVVGASVAIGVLGIVGARAASPLADPGPVRLSLDAFVADAKKLELLRRGVAAMKAREPSDHRSWFFQGAIHAYSDALYQDALSKDSKVRRVDGKRYWNRCPHFGQASADFIIWHRAYLHYFERTLRDAAQDPELSLPYWNYALAPDRVFPFVFAAPFLDAQKTQANPLYHPNRELAFVNGELEISGLIGAAAHTLAAESFFHEPGVTGFAGDHLGPDDTQIGLLEQRPHNDIHLAVGGVVNSVNGAMAEITTAAFDPVFWVHHANIDRLLSAWLRTPGKRWGTMPPDAWWDETPWVFLDSDGSEQSLSRRDYLALETPYDNVSGAALLQLAPKPQAVLATGAAPPRPRGGTRAAPPPMEAAPPPPAPPSPPPPQQRLRVADAGSLSLSPLAAGRRAIGGAREVPMVGAARGGSANRAVEKTLTVPAPQLASPSARVYLELTDIRFERVPSSGFAVFVDRAGAKAEQPIGLLDLFGATHRQMGSMEMSGASQRFDVTRIVRGGGGPFSVRIEPYDLLVTRSGSHAVQRSDAVHIGSVTFVVVS